MTPYSNLTSRVPVHILFTLVQNANLWIFIGTKSSMLHPWTFCNFSDYLNLSCHLVIVEGVKALHKLIQITILTVIVACECKKKRQKTNISSILLGFRSWMYRPFPYIIYKLEKKKTLCKCKSWKRRKEIYWTKFKLSINAWNHSTHVKELQKVKFRKENPEKFMRWKSSLGNSKANPVTQCSLTCSCVMNTGKQ